MGPLPPLLTFLLAVVSGWVHRHQLIVIEFLQAENQMLASRASSAIAGFVVRSTAEIAVLFTEVLLVCSLQGLIGWQMFVIDGVKLSSNASKAKSGTRKEMQREAGKMRRAVQKLLAKHRAEDERADSEPSQHARELRRLERLKREAQKVSEWLKVHP